MISGSSSVVLFDSLRMNGSAGGVLEVADLLFFHLLQQRPDAELASARWPRLFTVCGKLPGGRFVFELCSALIGVQGSGAGFRALFPNYFLPLPRSWSAGCVVVIHDLQFRHFPHFFSRAKRIWLDRCCRTLAKSNATVVFISESTRDDFFLLYGAPHRSVVIYNPVRRPGALAAVKAAPSFGRYLVGAYHFYPHKNFQGLLDVFASLSNEGLVDSLVLTGNGRVEVERMLKGIDPALARRVHHLGFVEKDELFGLFAGSVAYCSMSRFEGFNLSAAEAALCGVPLFLSDIPVHRELFSGYAKLVQGSALNGKEAAEYLRAFIECRPKWSRADRTEPSLVAAAYLTALEAASVFYGAGR